MKQLIILFLILLIKSGILADSYKFTELRFRFITFF